jgi:IclR family mhp operon transcriptional activator
MASHLAGSDASQKDSIRAVERAIDLLQALNRRPISTLHELHQDTGLPKPSLVRLLHTLEVKGLVTHSAVYGSYQLLATVKSLSSGFHNEPLIIEIAEELMIDFTSREGWPLALALFERDVVVVRASTIPYTSLSLFHSSMNMRHSLITRALGRAYLAFCSPNVQRIILEILKGTGKHEDAAAKDTDAVLAMLEKVRAQGYALRDPIYEPRTSTLAVPVMLGQRVAACLGMTWITAAMTPDKAIDRYLTELTAIAQEISSRLSLRTSGKAAAADHTVTSPQAERQFEGVARPMAK